MSTQGLEKHIYLHRSERGVKVLACNSRLSRYWLSSARSNSAIDWERICRCRWLACACSTDDQMSLNEETADARKGTGVSEEHWCIGSMVKSQDHIRQ